MPAITLIVNEDGSVSPGLIMTPGPKPILDGVVVSPKNKDLEDLKRDMDSWNSKYWNGGIGPNEDLENKDE